MNMTSPDFVYIILWGRQENLDLSAPYMNIENGNEVDYSEEFKSVIMVNRQLKVIFQFFKNKTKST